MRTMVRVNLIVLYLARNFPGQEAKKYTPYLSPVPGFSMKILFDPKFYLIKLENKFSLRNPHCIRLERQ